MKPMARAISWSAALAPSRAPTTKAEAFKVDLPTAMCIPARESSTGVLNKTLRRIADRAAEQRSVRLEQRHQPLDDHPDFARVALVLMRHQPLLLHQFGDRRRHLHQPLVAVAGKARTVWLSLPRRPRRSP